MMNHLLSAERTRHFPGTFNFPNSLCVVVRLSTLTVRKYQLVWASLSRSIAALLCLFSVVICSPEICSHNFHLIYSECTAVLDAVLFSSVLNKQYGLMENWATKKNLAFSRLVCLQLNGFELHQQSKRQFQTEELNSDLCHSSITHPRESLQSSPAPSRSIQPWVVMLNSESSKNSKDSRD